MASPLLLFLALFVIAYKSGVGWASSESGNFVCHGPISGHSALSSLPFSVTFSNVFSNVHYLVLQYTKVEYKDPRNHHPRQLIIFH
ncbi:hypothetical protein PVK06_015234 [Gossypium arboreum]|uniref:Uncharacterized protein n=1 Tax=Gossypium arboreum TaxID=29729 RepID=A0ABR0PWX2_GOSAR|nr:hypothetical protein PVK06_015234 [Gossypium arboreum]